MSKFFVLFSIVLIGFLTTQAQAQTLPKPAPTKVEGKINWVFNLNDAKKQSRESGKPIFIVFRCER